MNNNKEKITDYETAIKEFDKFQNQIEKSCIFDKVERVKDNILAVELGYKFMCVDLIEHNGNYHVHFLSDYLPDEIKNWNTKEGLLNFAEIIHGVIHVLRPEEQSKILNSASKMSIIGRNIHNKIKNQQIRSKRILYQQILNAVVHVAQDIKNIRFNVYVSKEELCSEKNPFENYSILRNKEIDETDINFEFKIEDTDLFMNINNDTVKIYDNDRVLYQNSIEINQDKIREDEIIEKILKSRFRFYTKLKKLEASQPHNPLKIHNLIKI